MLKPESAFCSSASTTISLWVHSSVGTTCSTDLVNLSNHLNPHWYQPSAQLSCKLLWLWASSHKTLQRHLAADSSHLHDRQMLQANRPMQLSFLLLFLPLGNISLRGGEQPRSKYFWQRIKLRQTSTSSEGTSSMPDVQWGAKGSGQNGFSAAAYLPLDCFLSIVLLSPDLATQTKIIALSSQICLLSLTG